MTDPYIHEDHVHEDHIHEERTDTLVERETNPLGAVLAVVVVIFILALVWWMLIAPRSSNGTFDDRHSTMLFGFLGFRCHGRLSREGRLREFRDGPRLMFKADQVEAIKADLAGGGTEISLAPGDSSGSGAALAG